jgi:hypothetical protein
MAKAVDVHGGSKAADHAIENVAPKVEQARVAAEEEHQLSVWSALTTNKTVVFRCVFFAFSVVGWSVCPLNNRNLNSNVSLAGVSMLKSTVP